MFRVLICVLCCLSSIHPGEFFSKQQTMQLSLDEIYEKVSLEFAPEWVDPVTYSDYVNKEKGLSRAQLLLNTQVNSQTRQEYFRSVSRYLSVKSIQDFSTLEICFDPSNETIQIHEVNIIRNGKLINKLPTLQIRILHPASDSLVYQGDETLILLLDELRVGDILDYSFTRSVKESCAYFSYCFQGSSYVNKRALRCVIPKDQPVFIRSHFFDQEPLELITEKTQEYSWECEACEAAQSAHEAPDWYFQCPYVELSFTDDWGDIARRYRDRTFPEKNQSSTEAIHQLTQKWKDQYKSKEDQVSAAIGFVSNDIFYRSMHEGELFRRAHQPCDVLKQGYGDCKDKTFLLVELLRGLGVCAYPAAVDTEYKYQLQSMLPGYYFNHVIVYYTLDGVSYFVDPTCQNLGGQGASYWVPDYGFSLILKEDTQELTRMPLQASPKETRQVWFKINQVDNTALYQSTTQFFHSYADGFRCLFETFSDDIINNQLIRSLEKDFGKIEVVTPRAFSDDFKRNIITNSFSCLIKQMGQCSNYEVFYDFKPAIQVPYIPEKVNYKGPVALELADFTEIIDVEWDVYPVIINSTHQEYHDDILAYSIDWILVSDHHLRVVISYKVLKPWIDSDQLEIFTQKINQFREEAHARLIVPMIGKRPGCAYKPS